MKIKHFILAFSYVLLFVISFGQNPHNIDSLLKEISESKPDTVRIKSLNVLAFDYFHSGNTEDALKLSWQALQLAKGLRAEKLKLSATQLFLLEGNLLGNTYTNFGQIYFRLGDINLAIKYYTAALAYRKRARNLKGEGNSLTNIGVAYCQQGNYSKALSNFLEALKIFEKLNDQPSIAGCNLNIGGIYLYQNNTKSAFKYESDALSAAIKAGNPSLTALGYNNLGLIQKQLKNNELALQNHFKALELRKQLGDIFGIAGSYMNIALVFEEQKKYPEALKNYQEAFALLKQIGDKDGITEVYKNLGSTFGAMGNYKEAKFYLEQGLKNAKELGNKMWLKEIYLSLYYCDSASHNCNESLEKYKNFIVYKDSIYNDENSKKLMESQMQYEFDKKESLAFAEQEKKDALIRKEIEKQKLVRNGFIGGFILVILIALGIFRSLQINKRAKKIISHQKELVEEKNREILDSIEYAKRLQNAILPANKLVKEYLVDSFIYYRPKDIVAGDFYWFYPTKNERNENLILFAAADCTGHGVPGAMVSVVCANALNKAVKELHILEPGKILDAVSGFVVETFVQEQHRNEDDVQDGMDISLCQLNLNTLEIQWSGANNPLVIIKNSQEEEVNKRELVELKADKQPIGLYEDRKPFTTHKLQLLKGEMLYLFSDGYADQFGGNDGRKLMKKNLKNQLLKISSMPIDMQLTEMAFHFENWKGSFMQVDDVCLIGVRV